MGVLFDELYPAWELHGDFFGDYDHLDNVEVPGQEEIINYQLSIIRGAIDENSKSKWFLVEDLISSYNAMSFNTDEVINQAIENIFNNISSLRRLGNRNKKGSTQRKMTIFYNRLTKLITSINNLSKMDSFASIGQLTEVQDLIKYCQEFETEVELGSWGVGKNQGSGKVGVARKIIGILNGLQGALLEEEGTAWFSSRVPIIKTLNTAKLEVAGKGQMISDILFFRMDEISLMENIEVVYHYEDDEKGRINKITNLKSFFSEVEQHTGKHHIIIDSGIEKLFSESIAGVQAKSGKTQAPFNANKQNSFSIYGLDPSSYKRVLEELVYLYWWGKRYGMTVNESSDSFDALFNHAVSTKIPQIMQFNKNQFLLTRKGLISYSEYFADQMKQGRYFRAARPISLATPDAPIALTF